MLKRNTTRRAASRGLGLVEMLVGLAVGLFVVGGALMLLANHTNDNRHLLQETRVVQDLRATADLIARDLRRAGYWNAAETSVWTPGMVGAPPQNPYSRMLGAACAGAALTAKSPGSAGNALCYAVAQDTNNAVDDGDKFGFELDGGIIYFVRQGQAREALSHPKTIVITDLVITPSAQVLPAANFCSKACAVNCPEVVVREFEILIKGHLPNNAASTRFLRSNVRVRNDFVGGACPA